MKPVSTNIVTKADIIKELWIRGNLSYKLHSVQKELHSLYTSSTEKTNVWLLGRRCLAEGTLIKTPKGLVEIENLRIGDEVYGVDSDGTVIPTKIVNTFSNGLKEVFDLSHRNKVMETCTKDHVWQMQHENPLMLAHKPFEAKTENINRRIGIVRKFISAPGGSVVEPHAYVLGAFLGDGCCAKSQNPKYNKKLFISSKNDLIPKKCAEILDCEYKKCHPKNYTWSLKSKRNVKLSFNRYKKFCLNKKAHEKTIDLNLIKTWCRSSQLQFLAGLIDTDGSVGFFNNEISIGLGMQAYSVVNAAAYIIHNNFQYKPTILIDNRIKYKNGPVYYFSIKNIGFCKRILKSLDKYLVRPEKKYHPIYDSLQEYNCNKNRIGVRLTNPRILPTYDISIANETNLYLTANGLVTHNCGKSFTLVTIAIEECLKAPNTVVKLVAPTKQQMDNIVRPLFKQVLSDCPISLTPKYITNKDTYYFKNGSEIQLAGSDNGHAEKLRGSSCKVAFVDEAGSCDDLDNLIKDILLPCTLTTKGKIILATTPPKDPNHEVIKFIESAEKRGTLIKKTTYDNPLIPPEELELLVQELGGKDSPSFKREVMCELIRDGNLSVVPEFTDSLSTEIVKDWPVPKFFDTYEAMDLGFRDLTVVVFGYYDFKAGKIIVEDELVVNFQRSENTLPKFVSQIKEKENTLWFSELTQEVKPVTLRVSDLNPIVIAEIARASNYSVTFTNARKDDKEAAINQLRLLIASKKIIINPRCKTLINHLKYATWQPNRKLFARTEEGFHYDAVDALCYLTRAIHYNKNPYPKHYGMDMTDLVELKDKRQHSHRGGIDPKAANILRQIFQKK